MAKSLKTRFKQLMDGKDKIKIRELFEQLSISSIEELELHLKEWELDSYYDIVIMHKTTTPFRDSLESKNQKKKIQESN